MQEFWNKLSLRFRLFIAFGVLFALMTTLSLIIQSSLYKQSRVERVLEQEIPMQLAYLGSQIALQLSPSLHLSASLANNTFLEEWVANGRPITEQKGVNKELAQIYQQLNLASVFFTVNDGKSLFYYNYDGTLRQRDLNARQGDAKWYNDYLYSLKPYELKLELDEFVSDKELMFINYSGKKINLNGEPLIVAGISLYVDYLTKLVSQFKVNDEGSAALVHSNGRAEIFGEQTRILDFSSPELQYLLNKNEQVVTEINYKGEQLFIGLIWVADLERFLVIEIPRSSYMAPIFNQLYKALFIGGILLLISLALFYPLAVSLSSPLINFEKQLSVITKTLDLSRRIKTKDKSELGNLATQTNNLLESLQNAINGILNNSHALNEAAAELAQTAGLVDKNTSKQQEVSQSMAAAVEQMSSSVAEITSTMEELSASSTQIADHSQSVVDVANLTLDNSKRGAEAMQHLEERMVEIQQDSNTNLDEILALGSKSKEISKVMDIINTLADQTKLIAFNAALEASSAGEAGKRFSVVASEIRRLADSVTDSTYEIEGRVQEIQDSISRLVVTSEKSANSIELGRQVSSKTASDLITLVEAASRTSNAAQQISLSTKQQKTASSQVVIALHDIANASSHNAQSVRGITEISEQLVQMAINLSELVSEFNHCSLDKEQKDT